jgi:phosphopantetheinyl transferase (holo-ACP synthase)
MDADHGVVASAFEIVDIAEVSALPDGGSAVFTEGERAYAQDKSDPERRLAARLAAKRAALSLLGPALALADFEVVRGRGGPPALRLSARAESALRARGAGGVLVSLTHGREQAAAAVLLLRGPA